MTDQKSIIEIKVLRSEIPTVIPAYSTIGSAGCDLRAAIQKDLYLDTGQCELVPTGIAINITSRELAGIILPRSGLGHKKGLILGNSLGLIDSDYKGEIMVSCWNRSVKTIVIKPATRFAQLVIIPVVQAKFIVVNEFREKSKRGINGFGHTGYV